MRTRVLMNYICPFIFLLAIASPPLAQVTMKPVPLEPVFANFKQLERLKASGSLLYTFDNATYGDAGLNWPWNNVLVLQDFINGKSGARSYEVFRAKYDFVYDARWLGKERVIFKVGDPNSSFGTYDLALWNTKSLSVETLQKGLSWKQVWPSPSGRFIAFIKGGGQVPIGVSPPAFFCTLDLQTKEERTWSQTPSFAGEFWTPDDRIILSNVKNVTLPRQGQEAQSPTVFLSEGDALSGKEQKIRDDAFSPTVSPDGQWMTYFTFPQAPTPGNKPDLIKPDPTLPRPQASPTLMLTSRTQARQEPVKLRSLAFGSATIVWRPDSNGFLVCQRRIVGNVQGRRTVEIVIEEGQVNADKLRRTGAFRYFVPEGLETSQDDLLWRPLRISKDNRFLIFELRQFDKDFPQGLSLQAFEIATGKTTMWAHIGSVRGLDWRE